MTLKFCLILVAITLASAVGVLAQIVDDKVKVDLKKLDIDFTELLNLGPKKIPGLKLGDVSSNEINGFEFFHIGKLKSIKLGISDRENIRQIFGSDCTDSCDYDDVWRIWVDYFGEKVAYTQESYDGGKIVLKTDFIALPAFVGKIQKILFTSKKRVSFAKAVFLPDFYKSSSVAFGHDFSLRAIHTSYDAYTDGYGLKYEIFDKVTFNSTKTKDNRKRGDVIAIIYSIPDQFTKQILVPLEHPNN